MNINKRDVPNKRDAGGLWKVKYTNLVEISKKMEVQG